MLLRAIPLLRPLCVRCLTHYDVLGVPRTATKSDIKKAFLEKAKECHPDLNPDNEKAAVMFQEIQEAHDVLMSSKLRAQYNHQLNQESYYGSQQTHRPPDGPRRSKVRTHGVNNQNYSRRNDEFHENHRVNRDNYTHPGSLNRDYYTDPYSANMSAGWADQTHYVYMIGLAATGFLVYAVVYLMNGIKGEMMEGRHNKYKEADKFWSTLRSMEPVHDTVKYTWSKEKDRLVRADTLDAAAVSGLKEKFDDSMQSQLGEIEKDVVPEPVVEEKKPVTMEELSLLRIKMSKKKSEYLAAKREYTEKQQSFNEEQKEKKTKRKRQEVV